MNVYVDRGATAGLKNKTSQEIKKQMVKDLNRDKWFTAQEALNYGLIDEIVTTVDFYGVTGAAGEAL